MKKVWRKMDSAPKNEEILLDIGLIWPVLAIWNEKYEKWVYANLSYSSNLCDNNPEFQNEYATKKEAVAWMHTPKCGGNKK